ncbi:MAG TPA: pyruvate dehydrogenase [Gammaproteobacteria bacterium]|nr:pyruvate dehydrogenase [Gammaproteobacteria bacterium]
MSEPYEIKMPQLSDTMTEGVIVSWEKDVGDKVERGDIVATVETDKAIMDVEVFRDGFLSGPLSAVDSTVPVGGPVGYIVDSQDKVQEGESSAATPDAGDDPIETETTGPSDNARTTEAAPEPEGVVHTIKMPQLSDTMTEGIVVEWVKSAGDRIKRGEIVAQVETDKAIMDVEVFRDGYLSGPIAEVDSVVAVGVAMAYLVEGEQHVVSESAIIKSDVTGAGSTENSPSASTANTASSYTIQSASASTPASRPNNKQATPLARKVAGQAKVDLNNVQGKGPAGVITSADVLASQQAAPTGTLASSVSEVIVPGNGRPMNAMERAISHTMSSSLSMPTFNVTVNVKPGALIKSSKKKGVSLTVSIAKACALAIHRHPTMNWCYQPVDKLVERSQVDVGMAVSSEGGGLVVPILRACESTGLDQLNDNWKDLVDRARKRRLSPEEYSNPTFMVSNMGMLGVSYFDAIPTPGTAAILAISSAGPDGMPLTITADHRVVNGAEVALYLNTLKGMIEHPDAWMGPTGPAIPEGDWDYDVVIIGAGPGGEDCARDLAGHGIKVAMVNDAPLPGGECLWRGCIPSKAWRAAADRIRDRAHDVHLGVEGTTNTKLSWSKLEKTRRHVLDTRGEMALKTDKGVKIKYIHGFARFEDDHTLQIDQSGNSNNPHQRAPAGDGSKSERIRFGCAVIATGAPPFVPPIPGAHDAMKKNGVLTSDTVWGLKEVPKRLGVVGGGAIGMEMAQIFQDFGSKVKLIEGQDRILAEVEPEIARYLTAVLNDDPNLSIHTSAQVKSIKGKPGAMRLVYTSEDDDKDHTFSCDYVLMATGKRPVLEPLQLDNAGIEAVAGVIRVDARSRTSIPHIFAVGDVVGGLMLAHTAGQQGRVAAATIVGEDMRYDQDKDSGVIFTRPEAAFVGLSVDQAKSKGIDAVEVKMPMSIDAKAMITNEIHGMIKIVADKSNHRIVGVHFLADHADTLIGEGVMMVAGELTLEQVAHAIHPHPTQTEMFGEMSRRLLSRLRRSSRKKR